MAMEMEAISSSVWTKVPPYFGNSRRKQFHDVRPRRDGIARAETNARGDQAVAQRLIAVHHDLMSFALLASENWKVSSRLLAQGITAVKRRERVFDNALVLAGETLGDEFFQPVTFSSNIRAMSPSA
jgi:hypothetical protein